MSVAKIQNSPPHTQVLAPQLSVAARNSKLRVYTLLIKEVADTHFKCIRDLIQPAQLHVTLTVNPVIHRLSADTNPVSQPYVTHVFFIITRRRFSCDS